MRWHDSGKNLKGKAHSRNEDEWLKTHRSLRKKEGKKEKKILIQKR